MKLKSAIATIAALVITGAAVFILQREEGAALEETHYSPARKIAEVKSEVKAPQGEAKRGIEDFEAPAAESNEKEAQRKVDYSTLSEEALKEELQSALDEDDFINVSEIAKIALKSQNKELRAATVNALGWFGEKAILDLARAMVDEDGEVGDSAREWVEHALMEIEDSRLLFNVSISCLALVEGDEDAMLMFSGRAGAAAMQVIDPNDPDDDDAIKEAQSARREIVEKIQWLIESEGSLSLIGEELYREISGEEWTTAGAADAWISDFSEFVSKK